MNDIFVSYKREDKERVARIIEGLVHAGLSVWWDHEVAGGDTWRKTTMEHLEAAGGVIVVWSRNSVTSASEFVHDEAGRAKSRGVLLPIRIDPVEPPLGFGQ